MGKLKAPAVNRYMNHLRSGPFNRLNGAIVYDQESKELLDELFELLKVFKGRGDRNVVEMWLCAERGTIEDFGDYEEAKEYGDVESYEEFEALWKCYYPEAVEWYNFAALDDQEIHYRAVFLGQQQVIEQDFRVTDDGWETNISEFINWMIEEVKGVLKAVRNGTYNNWVQKELPPQHRTGTVLIKHFWDTYPDAKEQFFHDITGQEIQSFVEYIREQPKEYDEIQGRLRNMTANRFFEYCALGYAANRYERAQGSPKEQYYAIADGRDEGLFEIDPDSEQAWDEWFHHRKRCGGHPWEVVAGGNSTHIDLFVHSDNGGYTLMLAGSSYGRTIETVKFYLALRQEGLPVYLVDGMNLVNRLLGEERIGIVPTGVTPKYCHSMFKGDDIIDFMNLPEDYTDDFIAKCVWQTELPLELAEV